MHERIWWRDAGPDWWETERREDPLFRALVENDRITNMDEETAESLRRMGALIREHLSELPPRS